MNNDNHVREEYRKYKANKEIAERDEMNGGIILTNSPEIVIDEHGKEHIVHERGKDYIIFKEKNTGRKYVSTKLSGNVPKRFFKDNKKEIDTSKPFVADLRDIDPAWYNTNEDVEWFMKPTQFKHFKARIDLLDVDDMGFYYNLKYKIINLIPTVNKELDVQIYTYLNDKYGKKELEEIIRKCARYRLRKEGRDI